MIAQGLALQGIEKESKLLLGLRTDRNTWRHIGIDEGQQLGSALYNSLGMWSILYLYKIHCGSHIFQALL